MKTTHLPCLVSLFTLGAVACGDDKRDPPPYESGVKSDAPVSQLDDQQKQQICSRYGAYVEANVDLRQVATALCLPSSLLAVGLTGSEADCERFLEDCTNNLLGNTSVHAQIGNDQACLNDLSHCNSSVADLELCVNANLRFPLEILERLSCRHAGSSDALDTAHDLDTANVCASSNRACAGFSESAPVVQ
jgi:hypothetical protein